MAATGTPTPNIGLRIPQGTDPASVDDINYNSNLIDTKLGAVGNDSVQDQIDSLNSNIENKLSFTDGDTVSSSVQKTITRTSSGGVLLLIVINGTADARTAILSARFASNGTAYITDIYKGSNISYTTDTNKIILSNSSSTSSSVEVIIFSGSITVS